MQGRGKPIQPTAAGTLLLRYTERMMSLASDAVAAANDLQEVRMGTMYVGASQTTGVYLMPKLIGVPFYDCCPQGSSSQEPVYPTYSLPLFASVQSSKSLLT